MGIVDSGHLNRGVEKQLEVSPDALWKQKSYNSGSPDAQPTPKAPVEHTPRVDFHRAWMGLDGS